jgi:uncharacterized protein (DUF1501 family)
MIYSRREVLKTMLLGTGVSLIPLWRHAWAAQVANPTANRLVVVFLRGAVDGLSLVVPYRDNNYYQLRSSIAIAPAGSADGVVNLDGYFGLHPALSSLMPLWQAGQLAFVQAAGSPDPSRSHFDAQAYMESGTPGRTASDGWMNRVLASLPGPHGPTQGISFGPTLPLIMKGSVPVETIDDGNPGKPSVLDRPLVAQAFDRMYANSNDVLGQSYSQGQQARHEIAADLNEEQIAANNGAPLPGGAFPKNTAQLARLMTKDGSVQLAFMALGGWDTHVGQGNGKGGKLAGILKPLGDGLAVLANQLGPTWNNTVVMVVSEFGRTAHENGGGGTDHGHGNVMWLLGGAVNGGKVYGEWPGIDTAHLYQGRDLAVTTDFRTVIAAVLERHLRLPDASLSAIFPNAPGGTQRWGGIIKV